MPTITKILAAEQTKDSLCIQFYSEGIFYKAYEQSAWLACLLLNRFTVKKKFIKKAGQDVISIGFPKTSLSKWAAGRRTDVSDDKAVIYINESEYESMQDKDFNKWKDTISNECGPTTPNTASSDHIIEKIRSFPVESKTPIECMMFLSGLKQELSERL